MKKTLALALAGLVAFAGVALWLDGRRHDDPDRLDGAPAGTATGRFRGSGVDPRTSLAEGEARREEPAPPSRLEPLAVEAAAAPATGVIRLEARLADRLPDDLLVDVQPGSGALAREDGAVEVRDLEPGRYRLVLHGADLVPRVLESVEVEAGMRRTLALDLERGVKIAGQVRLARSERPVAGALVELGEGMARIITDADGRFAFTHLLPRRALRHVRIRAEGLDEQVHRELGFEDPGDVLLYVGAGDVTLEGRLVNASDDPVPDRFVARLLVGHEDRERRRVVVEGDTVFRFENVYAESAYRVEVSFPDGAFPVIRNDVVTPVGPQVVAVPILLSEGADFEGVCVGPDALMSGLSVELRDAHNRPVARGEVATGGTFALRNVPAGRHAVVLLGAGDRVIATVGETEVADAGTRLATIDLLRHRLVVE